MLNIMMNQVYKTLLTRERDGGRQIVRGRERERECVCVREKMKSKKDLLNMMMKQSFYQTLLTRERDGDRKRERGGGSERERERECVRETKYVLGCERERDTYTDTRTNIGTHSTVELGCAEVTGNCQSACKID